MQKQVNFFEQHVQWFALGLGALFLLWMVFTYVLNPPLKVSAGGKEFAPGEIDEATVEGPITQLKRDIAKTSIPEIPQVDYVPQFLAAIQGDSVQLAQLSPFQIHSTRMIPEQGPSVIDPGTGTAVVIDLKDEKPILKLPKPPAARPGPANTGRSTVIFQDPNWVPRPNRPNDQPEMITEDKDWWSGSFSISAEALVKAFEDVIDEKRIDAANLDPAEFFKTAVLDVELVRREILPGNRAGKEVIIGPLKNNAFRPPFPGKNAREFEVIQYIDWATGTPAEVLTPVFYEITAGDPWTAPGEETEQLAAMTAEQRREARKQRQAQLQADRQNRLAAQRARQGGMRGVPGGLVGEEGFAPEMEMEGNIYIPPSARMGPRGIPQPPRFNPGMRGGRIMPNQPMQPQGQPIGPGKNDVRFLTDIQIIAHDDTIEAGKTYQYKIRYRLLNPVYKSNAAKPELTQQFAIVSADSPWTEPVRMRSKVEFFLANASREKATFDVFQWDKGRMKKDTVTIGAGDAIGGTGFSVVDVRAFGRKSYVLLLDDATSIVSKREPEGNGNESDRYLELLDEYELNNPQVGMR